MNKPINNQLELVPAAAVNGNQPAPELLAAFGRAGIPPGEAERLLAEAGPDDFDWNADDSVVVKPRPGVAVYENRAGDVVIRSQNTRGDEDDFAFVRPESLAAVMGALKDYLP